MWSIRVHLSVEGQPLVLMYESEDRARFAQGALSGEIPVNLTDDYGTTLYVSASPVATVLEDVRRALDGAVKRGVMQAEAQAKANRQAQAGQAIVQHPHGFRI